MANPKIDIGLELSNELDKNPTQYIGRNGNDSTNFGRWW